MLILFDVWNFEVKFGLFYSFCTQCAFSSSDATACFSYLLYPIKSSKCQTYSVSTLFELSKFFLKAHFLLWNGVNEFNSEILYLRICSDEKKMMLSSRLVLRDMCYCVHIHAKWLPTSSSKTTQGIPQTFVFMFSRLKII